jgi:hypothetical protein
LRNSFLGGRSQADALRSMEWLYGKQPGLGRSFASHGAISAATANAR